MNSYRTSEKPDDGDDDGNIESVGSAKMHIKDPMGEIPEVGDASPPHEQSSSQEGEEEQVVPKKRKGKKRKGGARGGGSEQHRNQPPEAQAEPKVESERGDEDAGNAAAARR